MNLKDIWGLIKTAAMAWVDDGVPRLGAALSYYTVFSISPLFLIVIFVASLWFSRETVQAELFGQVGDLIGKKGAGALQALLVKSAPSDQGIFASAVAIVTLLLSSTGLFIELQADLNRIWGVEAKPGQSVLGFVKNRLLSFAMVVGIGFLLLVSLVLSAALAAAGKYVSALVPGLDILWLIINSASSFLVITLLFAMIFKVLPDVRIAWRDVWVGAMITAGLFTGGKFLVGLYLGKNSTISAYGAAGSVVLILLWVYYSAQIMFFGAELTQAFANRFGARLEPKRNARWISPPQDSASLKKTAPPTRAPAKRKSELVRDLKQEVETLRRTVHQTRAR